LKLANSRALTIGGMSKQPDFETVRAAHATLTIKSVDAE
jgi:hypothetical protein